MIGRPSRRGRPADRGLLRRIGLQSDARNPRPRLNAVGSVSPARPGRITKELIRHGESTASGATAHAPPTGASPTAAGGSPTPPWLWVFLIAVIGLIIYLLTPRTRSRSATPGSSTRSTTTTSRACDPGDRGPRRAPREQAVPAAEPPTARQGRQPVRHLLPVRASRSQPVIDAAAQPDPQRSPRRQAGQARATSGSTPRAPAGRQRPGLDHAAAADLPDRRPDLLHDAPGPRPVRRRHPRQLRQEPRQAARQVEAAHHLRGGRRAGERQERAAGDRRVPQEPREVPAARRPDSQGRPADRPAGLGQDAAGPRRRRRGGGAVLLDLGLGVHPDVRRRRRQPRPRHVQDGQGKQPLHPVHRRDRRRRPGPRRRARRRSRRARADAQPDPHRDGRLLAERERHRPGRHQPPRRARPRPAAPRPVRPPRHRRPADQEGPAGDPQGPHPEHPAGRRRRPRHDRPGHRRHERRRPGQPGQRGRPARHPRGQGRPST